MTAGKGRGRSQGRPPKHGARQFARLFRENKLDQRTQPARMLKLIEDDLIADRGTVTNAERIAIRRCAFLVLTCESIEHWVLQQNGPLTADGELLEVLRKNGYGSYVNSLIRTLTSLGFRPERMNTLPSLSEHIARHNTTQAESQQ